MTTELEDNLRAALHARAAAITADRLRSADSGRTAVPHEPVWSIGAPDGGAAHRRSVGARCAPVVAAAAVVGIVVMLALLVGGGTRPDQPARGRSDVLSGVVGRTWVLKTVQAPDGALTAIPVSIGANVTFLGSGDRLEFQDGLAFFQAFYTSSGDGRLRIHDVSGDHSDYRGNDRSQLAAIAGIDAIGVPYDTTPTAQVQVQVESGRLHITTQGYRLTLGDPASVAPSASVAPPAPPAETATSAARASSASP